MIWIREDIGPQRPVDVVIFDVDGVLIDDTVSYYAAVKATVSYVVSELHHIPLAQAAVTDADIVAFKAAGGFNDDWDLAYALSGLIISGAARDAAELARIAGESASRGRGWVQQTCFPDLDLDYARVRQIGVEHYWGADRLREYLGRRPEYYAGAGFVRLERSLIPPDYFERLWGVGVRRFGIITGRDEVELRSAFATLGLAHAHPFDFILDAGTLRKPDPLALVRAFEALEPASALYLGDTGDGLRLVLHDRQSPQVTVPCLAAMIPKPSQAEIFRQAGADVLLDSADELPATLNRIAAGRRCPADGEG